jgi:putative FmdB family regulatory protein
MPTYEYACRDCGQHLEVVQSFRDEPLTTCPHCDGALRKVFAAAGIIFKGSGYYVNDSRKSTSTADTGSSEPTGTKEAGAETPAKAGKDTAAKDGAPAAKPKPAATSGETSAAKSA